MNGKMRPQTTPFQPKDLPLVPLPDVILPSYLVVAPPAQPFPISKDRHAILGPWVVFLLRQPHNTLLLTHLHRFGTILLGQMKRRGLRIPGLVTTMDI